jgi:transcriptional regulator with XRE-family HTH domain
MNSPEPDSDIFNIRRVNECIVSAKDKPVPKMLFGEFWSEGELAILFADTGKGKSILAVQIAESIARGQSIGPLEMTAKPQKVLYFDFELTDKQFEMRYSAEPKKGGERLRGHYRFSDKFYRADLRRNRELPPGFKTFEQYVRSRLEPAIRANGARVVIIDNITYLRGPNDTARDSLPLVRELCRLKEELGLSILVIAHTPKRDSARRITVNDLQGSKVLSNFADSIFAIGQSGIDSGIRYLKQLKQRSSEMLYDASYVPAFEIKKQGGNFLSFVFRKFSEEARHLSGAMDRVRQERAEVVAGMSKEGMSQRGIAAELGISAASVNRYLHMASPWNDDDAYNDDFYEDEEEEEETGPPPGEIAREEAARKQRAIEARGHTNNYMMSIGQRMPDEDKDGDEDEKDDEEAPISDKVDEPGEGSPPAGGGVEASSDDARAPGVRDDLDKPGKLVEIGELNRDESGRLRRRMAWGWNYCADALK